MAMEMERRFLVKAVDLSIGDHPELGEAPAKKLMQAYFGTAPGFALRLRTIDCSQAFLTVKRGSGSIREEWEIPIDYEFARQLFPGCLHFLQKRRYYRDGWEVDFYDHPLAGLITAEHEVKDKTELDQIILPPWIKEAVEVTDRLAAFDLARLAGRLRGLPKVLPERLHELLLARQF
ncbi:hypothetical protein HY628_00800 [Candidatus Uhrbacteria bacterium]|nr:hypothetical protein [Candidatus Uhrbacteria bacterium]